MNKFLKTALVSFFFLISANLFSAPPESQGIPELMQIINDESLMPKERIEAIDKIIALKAVESAPELVPLLKEKNMWLIEKAAEALRALNNKKALTEVAALLKTGSAREKIGAAQALFYSHQKESIVQLEILANDPDLGFIARMAMVKLADKALIPTYRRMLDNKDPVVIYEGIEGLGKAGTKTEIGKIVPFLDHKDIRVVRNAMVALNRLDDGSAAKPIVKKLMELDVFDYVISQIKQESSFSPFSLSPEVVSNLVELTKSGDEKQRKHAGWVLAALAPSNAPKRETLLYEMVDSYLTCQHFSGEFGSGNEERENQVMEGYNRYCEEASTKTKGAYTALPQEPLVAATIIRLVGVMDGGRDVAFFSPDSSIATMCEKSKSYFEKYENETGEADRYFVQLCKDTAPKHKPVPY